MTILGSITKDGVTLARRVAVEVEETYAPGGWTGVFEVEGDWAADHAAGAEPYTLHLMDGRVGEFIPARQVGAELGGAVILFRGIGALKKK